VSGSSGVDMDGNITVPLMRKATSRLKKKQTKKKVAFDSDGEDFGMESAFKGQDYQDYN